MAIIFMFPGQSSRYPEMLDRIIEAWSPAQDIVQQASDALGRDLLAHYRSGPEAFETNRDIQVGVFLASYLHSRALEDAGIVADASLGLSLGEYSHLVHVGALDFADGLKLVDARGQVYDEGPAGMMACIQPAGEADLSPLLEQVTGKGDLSIANFNSPSQQVIAGTQEAVEAAMALCEDELFVNPIVIERRIPMHTEGFRPASVALRPHLEAATWKKPQKRYLPNVTAEPLSSPEPSDYIELLTQHVYKPVQWHRSIDLLIEEDAEAVFVEVGPRGVLYNLLQKRWHGNKKFKSDSPEDLPAHLESLAKELKALS